MEPFHKVKEFLSRPHVALALAIATILTCILMIFSLVTLMREIDELEAAIEKRGELISRIERIETEINDLEQNRAEEMRIVSVSDEEVAKAERPFTITTSFGAEVNDYDPDVDYWALMADCVRDAKENNNLLALQQAEIYQANVNVMNHENGGDEWMDYFDYGKYDLDELYEIFCPRTSPYLNYTENELIWVASTIYREAGSGFVTNEHQQAVASVIVNRVTNDTDWSFKQQDTIAEVLLAPGQYMPYLPTEYDERSLENARYVLENGPINDGLFQDGKPHGSVIVATYSYAGWPTTTYICK